MIYVPYGNGVRVAQTLSCASELATPDLIWIQWTQLTGFGVKWNADVSNLAMMPRVDYITNSPVPIGIVSAYFTVDVEETR